MVLSTSFGLFTRLTAVSSFDISLLLKKEVPMRLIALTTVALALAWPAGFVHAQTEQKSQVAQKKPTPAKQASTTKAKPTEKDTNAAKRRVPAKTAKAVEANTPVEPLTARLTDAELAIAQRIHTGKVQCELGADVTVHADEKNPGFFYVNTGKRRYYMHPVESRTGALRMEDGRAGAMWLQLGNKSMLMDQRAGQRLADECVNAEQRLVAEHMKANPVPSLLEGLK